MSDDEAPRDGGTRPHTPIRVSMAALLSVQADGNLLLVRNLHRPEFFGPLGGVYKYAEEAIPLLDDVGFSPEGYPETAGHSALRMDLKRDLRGFLAPENLGRFLKWFEAGNHRENLDCLEREVAEELEEAGLPREVIELAAEYTFLHVRKVSEGPIPTPWGYDQFRRFDIFAPDYEDQANGARNLAITRRLFDLADHHEGLLVVTPPEIDRLRATTGQSIAGSVDYLIGASKRLAEPAPFGQESHGTEAHRRVVEFLSHRGCETLRSAKTVSKPTLIHGVNKNASQSVVIRVNCDGTPYIIKYYPDSSAYVAKEIWAIHQAELHGVRVPKIIEFRSTEPAFVVFEHLPGRRLADCSEEEIRSHLGGVLQSVSRLHKIECPHFGEIVGEFAPVGNHEHLADYARAFVKFNKSEIEACLKTRLRSSTDSSELLSWAEGVLSPGSLVEVESTLASGPRLCHSDVKLTDILVHQTPSGFEYYLIDFDNIFAFVPEFDLCKLHLSMIEQGIEWDLAEYSKVIATAYGVSPESALRGLRSIYPYVLFRLLGWAVKRNHQPLIDLIGKAVRIVMNR